MELVDKRPENLPPDNSRMETISFKSPADGCEVKVDVYSPSTKTGKSLPLVFGPHPISWSAGDDYHGGMPGLMREYHRGYYSMPEKYAVIIALPHGHEHREQYTSLAGPGQIADMAHLIDGLDEFGYTVDKERVYACGLSMGAQEALVLAGKHPDRIAAICVFNPIVDLAIWYEDLTNMDVPEIKEYDTASRIANEVGGLPGDVTELYAERSANNYIEGLAQVPTLMYWSELDFIVPRQISHHAMLLYRMIKLIDLNCPIAEYNHTKIHGRIELDKLTRWRLHEWCDYELALRWLLNHKKEQ